MTGTAIISCTLNTTDSTIDLGFEAWINEQKFYDINHVTGEQIFSMEIPDADGEHELKFILKNKKPEHTKIDTAGNIISDARLILSNLSVDEIKLGHMATELATYTHNFNGTKESTQNKFYGEMGCNGTVSLKFSTPIYMWLLENM